MRRTPATFDRRESIRRVGMHVVVIGMHACLWIILVNGSEWPKPASQDGASRQDDVLDLRFIRMPPRAEATQQTMSNVRTPARRPPERNARIPLKTVGIHAASIAAEASAPVATPTNTPSTTSIAIPGYVSGGNLLRGNDATYAAKPHLPGSIEPRVASIRLDDRTSIRDTVHGLAKALRCSNLFFSMENAPNPPTPQLMERVLQLEGCGPNIKTTANDGTEEAIAHREIFGN